METSQHGAVIGPDQESRLPAPILLHRQPLSTNRLQRSSNRMGAASAQQSAQQSARKPTERRAAELRRNRADDRTRAGFNGRCA
jgi:hypothetical protein